jgi:hypothetical protein
MKILKFQKRKTIPSFLLAFTLLAIGHQKLSAQEISVSGTFINQKPQLPATIKVGSKELPVIWDDIYNQNFTVAFERVIVNGNVTINGKKTPVVAHVWVFPENLVYLFDTGRLNPNKSEIFEAAKKLQGKELLNDSPDKKASLPSDMWGYIEKGVNDNQKNYVQPGKTDDWATSFLSGSKDNGLSYRMTLQPGAYKITVAHVPNTTASFASWLDVNKVRISSKVIKTSTMQDSIHPPIYATHELRLTNPTTITYEALKTAGYSNANVSLIAVERSGSNIALPVSSPASGDFWQGQEVILSHSNPNAEIYFSTDGSRPDKNSKRYTNPIKVNATTRINAVAYIGEEISKISTSDYAINTWATTATPFKLDGKEAVNNVKIHWEQRKDADLNKVYRDGNLIGQIPGDVYDDYDLEIGKTYSYFVEAYKDGKKIATSVPHQVNTFNPTGDVSIYNNHNGKNTIKRSRGFLVNNKYYAYDVREIEKSINGNTTKGRAIFERVSANGFDNWSERELGFFPNANFEGVGIVYNKEIKKIVIVAHYEDQGGYVAAKLYLGHVTPGGKLETTFCDRPLGFDSRDQSMFVDEDNTAYILSATNTNEDINIYKLDKTWSKPIVLVNTIFKAQHRETPYITKKDGEYYFFSSKASGWYPSQAMYASTTDLGGVWTQLRELGNNSTFGTQANSAGSYGSDRVTYGMYGYHWGAQYNQKDPDGNYPRLLYLNFNAGYASMEYYSKLEYSEKYGLIPVQAGKNLTLGRPVTATGFDPRTGTTASITDGADMNSSTFLKGNSLPYSITIDMEKNSRIKEIDIATKLTGGSETAYKYTVEASKDGKYFKTIADKLNNWQVGFHILTIEDPNTYRFLRVNIHKIINVHNNNSAEWADGIFEIAAYGSPE